VSKKLEIYRREFAGRTEGAVAIEFALMIFPFIYITFAIIELSLFFAASNMMESGINASARIIRTGQLQQQTALDPATAFRQEVCSHLFGLIKCENVGIEVIAMPDDDFGNAGSYTPVYDEDGNLQPRDFDAGESSSVVLIRAVYRYKLLTPFFANVFSKEPDHTIPIMTTVVLQTEPYDFSEEASGT